MIHRDLKPDNVFIDDANNPRIGDFGLATLGAIMTSVGTQPDIGGSLTGGVGTYFYLAPEVRSSTGQYDAKVDVSYRPMSLSPQESFSTLTDLNPRCIHLESSFSKCAPL